MSARKASFTFGLSLGLAQQMGCQARALAVF